MWQWRGRGGDRGKRGLGMGVGELESLSLDLTCFERFGIYLLCMLRMRFVSLKSRQTSRRNGEGE